MRVLEHEPVETLPEKLTELQKDILESTVPLHDRSVIREKITELQKVIKKAQKPRLRKTAGGEDIVAGLLENAETINGVTVVVGEIPPADKEAGRGAIDWIRTKTEASAVLLATAGDDKVSLIAGMSKDAVSKGLKAGDLIREVAPVVGGKGGGRPDMAQGGGTDPEKIDDALNAARQWIDSKLNA